MRITRSPPLKNLAISRVSVAGAESVVGEWHMGTMNYKVLHGSHYSSPLSTPKVNFPQGPFHHKPWSYDLHEKEHFVGTLTLS